MWLSEGSVHSTLTYTCVGGISKFLMAEGVPMHSLLLPSHNTSWEHFLWAWQSFPRSVELGGEGEGQSESPLLVHSFLCPALPGCWVTQELPFEIPAVGDF